MYVHLFFTKNSGGRCKIIASTTFQVEQENIVWLSNLGCKDLEKCGPGPGSKSKHGHGRGQYLTDFDEFGVDGKP